MPAKLEIHLRFSKLEVLILSILLLVNLISVSRTSSSIRSLKSNRDLVMFMSLLIKSTLNSTLWENTILSQNLESIQFNKSNLITLIDPFWTVTRLERNSSVLPTQESIKSISLSRMELSTLKTNSSTCSMSSLSNISDLRASLLNPMRESFIKLLRRTILTSLVLILTDQLPTSLILVILLSAIITMSTLP